jgi:hypothetical protein
MVMNGKYPGKVIQPGGANIHQRYDLFLHVLLQWMLIDRGMHACDALRHLDAEVVCQRNPHCHIPLKDLMTQPYGLDPAVTIDRIANADHRVGEVDEPGVGAGLFHIARDLHDGPNVARGMCEAARPAVLRIGLTHTIFDGDLKILLP